MIENIKDSFNQQDITSFIQSISVEQVAFVCAGIILTLIPLVFRKKIATFINNKVQFFLNKFKVDARSVNKMSLSLQSPLELLGVFLALSILINYFNLDSETSTFFGKVQNSIGVIIVFWIFHASIDLLSKKLKQWQRVFTKEMVDWVLKAVRVLIIFLAFASVLELWGIKVAPILAGLGLFGVAVALGAQDLFKNIIAGILVIAEKRFEHGDWIKIDGVVEGTVSNIGFRSTKVTRFDKAPVYVPNTKLSDNAVTNFSKMSHRQVKFTIGLLYSTTTEQLKQVCNEINDYIMKSDDFAKEDVTTFVKVVAFNASSIDIQIYAFTNTTVWTEWLLIREDLQCKIKEIVEKSGTVFAFPSTSLYIEADETKNA